MKILRMHIENYKLIKVMVIDLNGKNFPVAGNTGQGKTTAISILWDILSKVGDPLKHGEEKGFIKVVIGDDQRKIYATRKFTQKTNTITIMDSEGEKISASDFEKLFNKLGVNPHKIIDMGPMEQTRTLLDAVNLPKGINLESLDNERNEAAEDRRIKAKMKDSAISSLGEEPKKVERINSSELMEQYEKAVAHNRGIDDLVHEIENKNSIIETKSALIAGMQGEIEELEKEIKKLGAAIELMKQEQSSIKAEIKPMVEKRKKLDYIDLSVIKTEMSSVEQNNLEAEAYQKWLCSKKDAEEKIKEWESAEKKVKEIDEKKKDAIEKAKWPIKGIEIINNTVYYNGAMLSNCGKSQQMLVCGALAAASIKPNQLRVVKMDGIESMSKDDFKKLEKIFNEKDIQVLSSRVSRGDIESNEVVIEEGTIKGSESKQEEGDEENL